MNMKKVVIYLAIIAVLGIGTGLVIASLTGGFFSSTNNRIESSQVDDIQTREIGEAAEIIIEGAAEDIRIIPEERQDVKARLYGGITSSELPKMDVVSDGQRVRIKIQEVKKRQVQVFSSNLTLEVFIPKTYGGDLRIDSVSGNVEVNGGLTLQDVSIDLVSGDVLLKNLTAKKLKFEGTSGNLTADQLYTEVVEVDMVSGDVNMEDFKGKLKGATTSGNFNVSSLTFDHDMEIEAISGDIVVDLPEDAAFSLDAEALGDIQCDFPITVQGKAERNQLKGVVKNGGNTIKLRNTSGNVTIR